MFRRFRRPVTHAAALWILVGMAAGMFVAAMAYVSVLTGIRDGAIRAFPAKSASSPEQERLPSLFGKVCSTGVDGRLTVVSKQEFDAIQVDAETAIDAIGGAPLAFSDIPVGAMVMATGRDVGARTLAAVALTVVEKDAASSFGECPDMSGLGAAGSTWLDYWRGLPTYYAWNASAKAGAPVVAIREHDPKAPAASYELLGANGKALERIEIDVDDLIRRKAGNLFLDPDAAAKELGDRGFSSAEGELLHSDDGTLFQTPVGRWVRILPPNFVQGIGLRLEVEGALIEAVPYRALAAVSGLPTGARLRHEYGLSYDKRWLLAVFTHDREDASPLRSVHLIDLKKLGVE